MKIIYTCIGVFAVILALGVFFALQHPLTTKGPELPGEVKPQLRELSVPEYGVALSYPAAGYTVVPEEAAGDLVYGANIYEEKAYADARSGAAGELPPGLALEVYRNPMNLPLQEWITGTPASNYGLHTDPAIAIAPMGMNDFLRYQYDGLYRTDAYASAKDGYVYLFRNSWSDAGSAQKSDMERAITSVRFSAPTIPAQASHGDIRVDFPQANTEISSPVSISGEARGNWFFEASFPIVITDWDGRIIGEGHAEAQSDWMSENFVPFRASVTFDAPASGSRGAIILRKDNPSGLPENDDAIEVPVTFQ
jgi:hypothetical protein